MNISPISSYLRTTLHHDYSLRIGTNRYIEIAKYDLQLIDKVELVNIRVHMKIKSVYICLLKHLEIIIKNK